MANSASGNLPAHFYASTQPTTTAPSPEGAPPPLLPKPKRTQTQSSYSSQGSKASPLATAKQIPAQSQLLQAQHPGAGYGIYSQGHYNRSHDDLSSGHNNWRANYAGDNRYHGAGQQMQTKEGFDVPRPGSSGGIGIGGGGSVGRMQGYSYGANGRGGHSISSVNNTGDTYIDRYSQGGHSQQAIHGYAQDLYAQAQAQAQANHYQQPSQPLSSQSLFQSQPQTQFQPQSNYQSRFDPLNQVSSESANGGVRDYQISSFDRPESIQANSAPVSMQITPEQYIASQQQFQLQNSAQMQKKGPASNMAILPDTEHMPIEQRIYLYRENAQASTDPRVQLDYAKFLVTAASIVADQERDQKLAAKQRTAILQEAFKWVKRLASQGGGLGRLAYPEAQFFLANCYGNSSLGLQIDHDKAFSLYVQASKQNHSKATYRTAVCYELGAGTKKDHSRAVQFYRKAAALGDTAAMYKLGVIFLNGLLHQQKNPREAITWLRRAAAQADEENPHALHELGMCYEKIGVTSVIPDETYARELFTQAAQLSYAPSQFKMGSCYEYGTLTCPVDPRRSIAWYTRAAEQGDTESELALSGWYLTGSDGVLKQSDTEAYLWARKAADKGLSKAEYAVGYYAEVGIGIRKDVEEARRWYLRAAAQGNKRAMQRLTELKKGAMSGGAVPAVRRPQGQTRPEKDESCVIS